MKLRKQWAIKIIVGFLLLIFAMGGSYAIKDVLSAREPVNALPEIRILYNGEIFPSEYIRLASYSWRFLHITKEGELIPPDGWKSIPAGAARPNTPLDIGFSFDCKEIHISRATGDSGEFYPVSSASASASSNSSPEGTVRLRTPAEDGKYTYRVEANWGVRGSVQYYFKIIIGGDSEYQPVYSPPAWPLAAPDTKYLHSS